MIIATGGLLPMLIVVDAVRDAPVASLIRTKTVIVDGPSSEPTVDKPTRRDWHRKLAQSPQLCSDNATA